MLVVLRIHLSLTSEPRQDAPTGLENMPAFNTSLGCAAASHTYNSTIYTVRIPFEHDKPDHSFTVYGGMVGTLTLVDGEPDDTDVKYEFTIKSNDPSLLDSHSLLFRYADVAPDGAVQKSQFLITSPTITEGSKSCIRYDIKLFIPPSLKRLSVTAHAVMQLTVDPGSNFHLDTFYATLYETSTNNLILPHESLRADTLGLEVYRGWIVGDVSISKTTSISTQRGDGVANLKVHPLPPADQQNPEKAVLWTATGAGRSDFTWLGDSAALKRPIEADHKSSKNGNVYLTYRNANFKGLISLDSKSFTTMYVDQIREADKIENWTHWAGDITGPDRLRVESRGWTGLYFS